MFWVNLCPFLKGEYIEVARKVVAYSLLTRPDKGELLNILLVGDSSCGKSELLRSVSNLFEFCQFVSTNTSSAGLGYDARWGGKEGLAIKASGGFLLVDEFDKLDKEIYKTMLEVMDKQTVTVTKGGHRKIFEAKVNVIGACNQKNFRWDDITLDQIPLPYVLLTRFHLIIPLGSLDQKYYPDVAENYSDDAKPDFKIAHERFKMYVESSRNINVTISKEMSKYVGIFFQHMKRFGLDEYFPITPRQIEGFVSLAKAVARSRQKSIVDKECLMETAGIFLDVLKNYITIGKKIGVVTSKIIRFLEKKATI